MIAVDTNLLVYSQQDSPWNEPAHACVVQLAAGPAPRAIPWPCLHEFLAIVTHPRIYRPPTPIAVAVEQVESWLEAPGLVLLVETTGYWQELRDTMERGRVEGRHIHDARVPALCRHHGMRELWSPDRDFTRFSELAVRNPLMG